MYNQPGYNNPGGYPPSNIGPFDEGPTGKSRGIAALLAIFLGYFGVHYFYLGKTTAGILAILITICTCGAAQTLWFIQGIILLCMSEADFERKFIYSDTTFPLF